MRRIGRVLFAVGAVAALLAALVVGFGLREAEATPIERRASLALTGWPADTPPISVALLSDIHLGNRAMDSVRLRAIVDQVNATRPDLVLIAGDFIVGHDSAGAAELAAGLETSLSQLRARLGVVAVLGNHDHWTAPDAIRTALGKAGITVLANEATRRGPVTILGVDDAFSAHDDLAATIASWKRFGGLPVVLSHSPDLVHRLRGYFPLVLAGHTHCGQVVLPWFGPLLTRGPKQQWKTLYDVRYRCGVVKDPSRIVVVTAGLGSGTAPIRLGAPPDWWLLEIGPTRKPLVH